MSNDAGRPIDPDAVEAKNTALEAEVTSRFGLLPNFFQSASVASRLLDEQWGFARSAYIYDPLPSLFKEGLFVRLSRFCVVRYRIVRHAGFLVGNGRPAGDPGATPQTVDDVVRRLSRPGLPDADTREASGLLAAASIMFLRPNGSDRARHALRRMFGGVPPRTPDGLPRPHPDSP